MPVNGSQFDPRLLPVFLDGREPLGDADWFDAHTHIGQNDPDGRKATPEEILGGLDAAGPPARAALRDARARRLRGGQRRRPGRRGGVRAGASWPLARIAPERRRTRVAEARRCLDAGARGFKLHPRSDAFGLPHPGRRARSWRWPTSAARPVLFHAGRGIPHLGEAVVDLARRYPGARLILAHAGISDLGWIADEAAALPNLFFDTAWWNVADQLQLYTTIPPGRILYASDMPYAPGLLAAFVFLRVARAVGHGPEVMRSIAGGQLARIVAGEDPLDLGPAPGLARRRAGA